MALVVKWLDNSHHGYCDRTSGPGDCEAGEKGSVSLTAHESQSWELAAAACLTRCSASCRRCNFISVSLQHKDCSWFAHCRLNKLSSDPQGFRSGPALVAPPSAPLPINHETGHGHSQGARSGKRPPVGCHSWDAAARVAARESALHDGASENFALETCADSSGAGRWVQLPRPRLLYTLDPEYLPAFNESRWFWGRCRASESERHRADTWEWRPDAGAACALRWGDQARHKASASRYFPEGRASGGRNDSNTDDSSGCALGTLTSRLEFRDAYFSLLPASQPGDSSALPRLAEAFCHRFDGITVLFVGDSISGQMFTSFVHLLGSHETVDHSAAEPCGRYHHPGGSHEISISARVCSRYCAVAPLGISARFVRNEHLMLSAADNAPRRRQGLLLCDWEEHARAADLIVLNRGMHTTTSQALKDELGRTLVQLSAIISPRARVVYRATHASVSGCKSVPDPSPFLPIALPADPDYHWETFCSQNAIARRLVSAANAHRFHEMPPPTRQSPVGGGSRARSFSLRANTSGSVRPPRANGFMFLDVFFSSALRAGAPRPATPDPNECAHFCLPGVIDDWNALLFYQQLRLGLG